MSETVLEENDTPEKPSPRLRFDLILPVLFRPRRGLQAVAAEEHGIWLAPLLVLSLLAILHVLVAGPLRTQEILNAPISLPEGFEYYSPDQQEKMMEAAQPKADVTRVYIFPALGALLGTWVSWFILAGLLHLALTLSGGRGSRSADFNVAAWGSLPLGVRLLVQTTVMLFSRQLILKTGLSGFAGGEGGGVAFLSALLALVDIYLIWQIVLLILGAGSASGLGRGKTIGAVLIAVLLLLALQALPGFASSLLSGLTVDSPFFFF
jgi:hypothetical protein